MSIMSTLFGGGNATPAAPAASATPAAQAQPGNLPATGTTSPNPVNPANPADITNTNIDPAAVKNPLDEFNELWDPVKTPEGAPVEHNMFNVDPQKLMEAAGKVDFGKVVKPETLAAITAGGEGATQAFLQAMNGIAQTVYAQSALATTKIVEQAVNQTRSKFDSELPGILKKHQVGNTLADENPAFQHPAVQPLIKVLESQFTTKHPDATPAQISAHAKQYLKSAFEQLIPGDKTLETASKTGVNAEIDWDALMLGNSR